jgi:hypothetical protein
VLARRGYRPLDTASYGPSDTLHVLVGRSGAGERAFFFDQATFLGTDASAPSERISVLAHGDSEVTLGYAIYAPGAKQPSSLRRVHFALDMGQLAALDPLPPVADRR